MQGLSDETSKIFEAVSKLNCIKNYILIGSTALSLQTGHRTSEDLDDPESFRSWDLASPSSASLLFVLTYATQPA
jgi:hypothetical protein